jgi:hypothetical protein
MHKTKRSGHYDREVTTTIRQGKPLRGRMSVHDGAVNRTFEEKVQEGIRIMAQVKWRRPQLRVIAGGRR